MPKPQKKPQDDLTGSYLKQLDQLKPYPKNARVHSPAQVDEVAKSIKEFGWTSPMLIGKDNVILAGHCRRLAALKLGITEVPCIDLSHMTKEQAQAYIIADNQLALNANWNNDFLSDELHDLDDLGFDLSILGFSTGALDALLNQSSESKSKDTEISENDFSEFDHKCPKCGFEYD